MRIGLVTHFDVRSPWARSTVLHHMTQAVAGLCDELVPYGPVELLSDRARGALATASRRVRPQRRYSPHYSVRRSRELARVFRRRFERNPTDVIFAPKGSVNLAFLELPVPVIYESDATFALLEGYYDSVSDLCARNRRAAHELERRSMERADALVFHTRWAADSAVRHYGADPAKVHAIPIGPNFDPQDVPSFAELAEQRTLDGRIRLLFLGVNWERKGGAIALEALEALTQRGVDAELVVCGCEPPVRHPRMRRVRYLSKANPAERAELLGLFREATFLFVPTRAECFGCVFVEASAWALPSLTTRTGGVPEAVVDGVNGTTLPLEAGGDAYAEQIVELLEDPARYAELVRTSRQRYDEVLNWTTWAQRFQAEVLAQFA